MMFKSLALLLLIFLGGLGGSHYMKKNGQNILPCFMKERKSYRVKYDHVFILGWTSFLGFDFW